MKNKKNQMIEYYRFENIARKFRKMFSELTGMNLVNGYKGDFPESFSVSYSRKNGVVERWVQFSPSFCRYLDDCALFAETHVIFVEKKGLVEVCFWSSFGIEEENVEAYGYIDFYERHFGYEKEVGESHLKQTVLKNYATDKDILNCLKKEVSDSIRENPAYVKAKTYDELIEAVTPKRTAPDPDYPEDFDAIPY